MTDLFQNTLLIFKADYMHQRKAVLLKLLQHDFQIQGQRKLLFSPEHAAEFYKDLAEQKTFMLQVILLSKGNSEAFILTKENAVKELITTLICYFGTSMEMERNVHVTQREQDVKREIQFIFPNYIHEPISIFEGSRFCQRPLISPLINELYDITQETEAAKAVDADNAIPNWRVKLAEWLMLNNKSLPRITNQCSLSVTTKNQDKGQQTSLIAANSFKNDTEQKDSPPASVSSRGSSMIMSSSSCVSCTCFDGTNICKKPPTPPTKDDFLQMIKAKTQEPPKLEEEPPREHGEGLHWIEATSEQCSDDGQLMMAEHEIELESHSDLQSNQGDGTAIVVEDADD